MVTDAENIGLVLTSESKFSSLLLLSWGKTSAYYVACAQLCDASFIKVGEVQQTTVEKPDIWPAKKIVASNCCDVCISGICFS